MKGDLHIHTDISDCSYTTEEVIRLAKENGLTHISITNHDTIKGLKEAIEIGKKYGVVVIPGVEISAYDYKRNRRVHILGHNIDINGENITKLCENLLNNRDSNTKKQLKIIQSLGYDITEKEVGKYAKNSEIFYKQHIMQVLIDKGYTNDIYSDLYSKFFKKDGPCKMSIKYIDIYDAIEAIIKDGGIPTIAHPGQLKSYELIEELVSRGLVGIEKYHPSHTKEDYDRVDELAKKYNLIITGGSDFHGKYAKNRSLGEYITPEDTIKFILDK